MGIFSALGLTSNDDEKAARRDLRNARETERQRREKLDVRSDSTRSRYLGMLNDFNPQEYMANAASSVGETLQEGLTTTLANNNQSLNERGFFGSGLNTAKITKDFQDRLSRALAALSLQSAGLESERIGAYGQQGRFDAARADQSRDRELDLVLGNVDAESQAREGRLGTTLGLLKGGAQVAAAI